MMSANSRSLRRKCRSADEQRRATRDRSRQQQLAGGRERRCRRAPTQQAERARQRVEVEERAPRLRDELRRVGDRAGEQEQLQPEGDEQADVAVLHDRRAQEQHGPDHG